MIVEEKLGRKFVKHFSDRGMKLKQLPTGILYDEAIDLLPCNYTYEETEEQTETVEDEL